MAVVWLEPGPESNWTHYRALIDEHGWRDGEPFHDSESDLDECPFVTSDDSTRVVIYHPKGGVTYGGERAIAVAGEDAERVADLIAKRLPIHDRRVEPEFHRHKAIHTAACAGDGGVWYLASEHGVVMWQDAFDNAIPRIVAEGIPSSVALAGGADALYVTSCDDPLASRLARVDPRTGAVTWLCDGIERPTQLAVIGTTVYVACASGLLAVDAGGNRELVAQGAPRPYLLASALSALYWIDVGQSQLVRFANGRAEILVTDGDQTSGHQTSGHQTSGHQTSGKMIALDVDHDRVYLLETVGRVRECRSGHPAKTLIPITHQPRPEIGGVLRLGPMIVTGEQWDDSYSIRSRCDLSAIQVPLVDEAPPELLTQVTTDASAAEVLADWLAERGVVATADQLLATVGKLSEWGGSTDSKGGELAPPIATSLVTFDREVGYRVVGARVRDVLRAREWY